MSNSLRQKGPYIMKTDPALENSAVSLHGTRFFMPREGKEPVEMNLYLRNDDTTHPLVINLHGGAFIAGDVDAMDEQSDRISKAWNVNVATVDYKLLSGSYDIPYGTNEVIDTVKYFREHAQEYQIDPAAIFLLGYSAGAYYAVASTLALKQEGFDVAGQIICYGFLKEANYTYLAMDEADRTSIAPALFILADNDPISESSLTYQKSLEANGIPTQVKKYKGALHTFMEGTLNMESLASFIRISEQELLARQAENLVGEWIHTRLEA